jgi:putative phosphoesterase
MKLLIISDIHANWPALEAVLRAEGSWDDVAFCGDVVDYGPHPVECLRWLARYARYRVRGNHDNALAFGVDCRCMGSFREASLATRAWHRTLLAPDDFAFLRALPTLDWFEWDRWHFRMSHATPQGDLFEYLAEDEWEQQVKGLDSNYVILGHTHIQDMRRIGHLSVVNPGSVGLNRDGSGTACYAVHDGDGMTLKRVAYDFHRTIASLRPSRRHT